MNQAVRFTIVPVHALFAFSYRLSRVWFHNGADALFSTIFMLSLWFWRRVGLIFIYWKRH